MIARDPHMHGSMLVPVILGSDKTMVSVATGWNEYYPLYASIGNVQNHVRRAHRNAVSVMITLPGWTCTIKFLLLLFLCPCYTAFVQS
jgi:hypothetical protein